MVRVVARVVICTKVFVRLVRVVWVTEVVVLMAVVSLTFSVLIHGCISQIQYQSLLMTFPIISIIFRFDLVSWRIFTHCLRAVYVNSRVINHGAVMSAVGSV